jgi:hypothetical protein
MKISVVGLNLVREGLQRDFRKLIKEVADITQQEAVKATPKDTGHARSQWKKTVTESNFSVNNHVPYIEALEKNHSKQTRGKGIIMPTINNTNRRMK